jgi:Xaa-Pro aminopeptidase
VPPNELYLEKLKQASRILQELDLDVWLIIERETALNADPITELLWNFSVIWPAAFLITADGQRIATGVTHDVPSFSKSGLFTEVISFDKTPEETLPDIIKKLDPVTIALNYSEQSPAADGLSHGLYLRLLEMSKDTSYPEGFVSAERLIGLLRQRKLPAEIALLKQAVRTAEEILQKSNAAIRPGMTETDIARTFLEQVRARGIGTSWDASHCPNVNAGPRTGRGHLGPQPDVVLEKGHILNIDFGVKENGYTTGGDSQALLRRPGCHSGRLRRPEAWCGGLGSGCGRPRLSRERWLPILPPWFRAQRGSVCSRRRRGYTEPALAIVR